MNHELDARYLLCPFPVIRTQDKVNALAVGDELSVISTDPGAKEDIPTWCRMYGHEVLAIIEENNEIIIRIKIQSSE